MRVKFLFASLFFALTLHLNAHPGDGIVADSKGNVYFTDLKHVWKITPKGTKSIVVRDKHTHELFMDSADNLYGEDSQYDTVKKTWSHSIWKLTADGRLEMVVPFRPGFREDVSFVRDTAGNQYFLRAEGTKQKLTRKVPSGPESTLVANLPRSVLRSVGADGHIYLTQGDKLLRVSASDRLKTVASGLTNSYALGKGNEGLNVLYGLTATKDGTVYLTYFGGRKLLKITPQGQVSHIYSSGAETSPTGVTVVGETIYVLEHGVPSNPYAIRVVKITRGKVPVTVAESSVAP